MIVGIESKMHVASQIREIDADVKEMLRGRLRDVAGQEEHSLPLLDGIPPSRNDAADDGYIQIGLLDFREEVEGPGVRVDPNDRLVALGSGSWIRFDQLHFADEGELGEPLEERTHSFPRQDCTAALLHVLDYRLSITNGQIVFPDKASMQGSGIKQGSWAVGVRRIVFFLGVRPVLGEQLRLRGARAVATFP